jgi:seryl-tRNA synthetase
MPLVLLSQVPFWGRAVSVLALVASVFFYGYQKGLSTEHDRLAAEQAQLLAQQLKQAEDMSRKLSEQAFEAKKKQDEIASKNAQLSKQVHDLLASRPKYSSKGCDLDDDVIKLLRGDK